MAHCPQIALLLAVAVLLGACGSGPAQTSLPDASALPQRTDVEAERQRAAAAMRELAKEKSQQAETANQISKTR